MLEAVSLKSLTWWLGTNENAFPLDTVLYRIRFWMPRVQSGALSKLRTSIGMAKKVSQGQRWECPSGSLCIWIQIHLTVNLTEEWGLVCIPYQKSASDPPGNLPSYCSPKSRKIRVLSALQLDILLGYEYLGNWGKPKIGSGVFLLRKDRRSQKLSLPVHLLTQLSSLWQIFIQKGQGEGKLLWTKGV